MPNIKIIYWRSLIYILFDALSQRFIDIKEKRKHLYVWNKSHDSYQFEHCDLAFICHLVFDIWYFRYTNGNLQKLSY